jgi:4-cresol dehydrogenase (hydroxylating)
MSAIKKIQQTPNISLYPTIEYSELQPNSLEELVSLTNDAISMKTKLYPISTGFNWGMGSKIPVDDDCKIVNLSKMNKIIQYDDFSGTVIIEPGVTQEQLMEFLLENGSKHYIDVTGSSKSTSIMGNALERGITYNTQRNESILGLEVLTGNGDLIKTGSWRLKDSKIQNIYKHGIGANLTDLFFQSNFGIVTKLIIKLPKVKKYNYSILIQYNKFEDVARNIETYNRLLENQAINSIFHIANSERAQGALLPALEQRLSQLNCSYDLNKLKKIVKSTLNTDWIATGFISSDSKKDLKVKIGTIKKEFSKHGKLKIVNIDSLDFIKKHIKHFSKFNIFKLAYGIYPFKTLYVGRPTDAALGSVVNIQTYLRDDFSANEVDKSDIGFAYCLPLLPMDEINCTHAYNLINSICESYDFPPSITLNPVKENLLEAVVSINYESKDYDKSRECIRELQKALNKSGYYSYRTNIKDMDLYFTDKNYVKYLKGIKNIFDPLNIISPGRYLPQEKIKIQH